MAETIVTVELSKAMQAALRVYVSASTAIHGVGVDVVDVHMPCVGIRVSECSAIGYKSGLRTYHTVIQAATNWHADKDEIALYSLAQTVSLWVMSGPALNLTLAHFDALYPAGAPDHRQVVLPSGAIINLMQWECEARLAKVTAALVAV